MAGLGGLSLLLLAFGPSAHSTRAARGVGALAQITIDTDALTITGDDGNPNSFNGTPFVARVEDGVARFYIAGDLIVNSDDVVRGVGSRPASLVVGGNLSVAGGAVFDFSADDAAPGPGGGAGNDGGDGGPGGRGGSLNYGASGGLGGTGGYDAFPFPVAGTDGVRGKSPGSASAGISGAAGDAGEVGVDGFNSPSSGGAGGEAGTGASGGAGGTNAPTGGAGGAGKGFGIPLEGAENKGEPGSKPNGDGDVGKNALSPGNDGGGGSPGMNTAEGAVLSGGGGGGGGGGAGGGGGGGGGQGGAGGGGGGGGGYTLVFTGQAGGRGGSGGYGGLGGNGGDGGQGGPGGHGGGALEIVVFGQLDLNGTLRSNGGDGQPGGGAGDPSPGRAGSSGQAGQDGIENPVADDFFGLIGSLAGGDGGDGSRGGTGGDGSEGGAGGGGGGGAGGGIKLTASTLGVTVTAVVDSQGGGPGQLFPANDGGPGRFLFGSNTTSTYEGGEVGGAREGAPAPQNVNPHLRDGATSPYIPQIIDGPEAYGLTEFTKADFATVVNSAPAGAVAALLRLETGPAPMDDDFFANVDYDVLLFINLSISPLDNPRMGVGFERLGALRRGGFTRDERFGGSGVQAMSSIAPSAVYATLIPTSSTDFNIAAEIGGQVYANTVANLGNNQTLYLDQSNPIDTGILRVRADGAAPTDPWKGGTEWASAINDLQRAISRATDGDGLYPEIWVASGSYAPTSNPTDRDVAFRLAESVEIYGGFAGTETGRNQRDPATFPVFLTGDIGGGAFSYHVVEAIGVSAETILDGFVIQAGVADEPGGTEGIPAFVFDRGAGIYIRDASPTIVNCQIRANEAHHGAGVAVISGDPSFTDCVIRFNDASISASGVLIAEGAPTFVNVTIVDNEPTTIGGGVAVFGGSTTFTNVEISGHSQVQQGGGAYIVGEATSVTFVGCSISGNEASVAGGGVYNDSAELTILNSTISMNSTTGTGDGAGIYIEVVGADGPTVTITDSAIENNASASDGGGIYAAANEHAIAGGSIVGNTAAGNGGGVYLTFTDLPMLDQIVFTVDSAAISGNSADSGGGIYTTTGATIAVVNSAVMANTATSFGGGGSLNGFTTVTGGSFSQNNAQMGGGIAATSGELTVTGTTIAMNAAATGAGGVLLMDALVVAVFDSVEIESNTATTGNGGGLYILDSTLTLTDSTLTGNDALAGSGGGMYISTNAPFDRDNPKIFSTRFESNSAGASGGGIFVFDNSEPIFDDLQFVGNSAGLQGGGVYHAGLTLRAVNLKFFDNSAVANGGGYFSDGDAFLINPVMSGNSAVDGGAIFVGGVAGDVLTLINASIGQNSSSNIGAGIQIGGGSLTVTNSIVWNNTAGDPSPQINGGSPKIMYSIVQGLVGGEGNLDVDPLFVDADGPDNVPGTEDDDFTLQSTSPAIDAGENDTVTTTTAKDAAGNLRRFDAVAVADTGRGSRPFVDIGAYEFASVALAGPLLVDPNGTPGSVLDLQSALVNAGAPGGDAIDEIWVIASVYRPTLSNGDRDVSFVLAPGVKVYGGFPSGATSFDQRNPQVFRTVLSGDLNGDDGPDFANNEENSRHVVTAREGVTTDTILDGFIIEGGRADGEFIFNSISFDNLTAGGGGGIMLASARPYIRNCVIRQNAARIGGGFFVQNINRGGSDAIFEDCVFTENAANIESAPSGGAISVGRFTSATFIRCEMIDNLAMGTGGAYYTNDRGGSAEFIDCLMEGNEAAAGGAISNNSGTVRLTRSIVRGNALRTDFNISNAGAAIRNGNAGVRIVNSIIAGNTGAQALWLQEGSTLIVNSTIVGNPGGAIRLQSLGESRHDFANTIFWENREPGGEIKLPESVTNRNIYLNCTIHFPLEDGDGIPSHVTNVFVNTIFADPGFVDMAGPDGVVGTADDDLRLRADSSSIDSGTTDFTTLNNNTGEKDAPIEDFLKNPRPSGLEIDRGAYEATPMVEVDPVAGLDFGQLRLLDAPSPPQVVDVTNVGIGALNFGFGGVRFTGPNADSFRFSPAPVTDPVASLATRGVSVVFFPLSAGVKNAALEINTDDPVNPAVQVPLTGEGTLFVPTPTPPPAPVITVEPADQAVNPGKNVAIGLTATGALLNYQWMKNGSDLTDGGNVAGSSTPRLTLSSVGAGDAATYQCRVSNSGGQTLTREMTLTVFGARQANSVQYVADTVPALMLPGQSAPISITLRNTSGVSWSAQQGYAVALDLQPGGLTFTEGERISIADPNAVVAAGGGEITFGATMTAPPTPGDYTVGFRMIEELVEFFPALGQPALVTRQVTVGLSFDMNLASPSGVAPGWEGGALAGFDGTVEANATGLCMTVPGPGDNATIWVSPPGMIPLIENTAYRVRTLLSTDQPSNDAIPLFNVVYDNFHPTGGGNFGGELWLLDVDGGANGIGRPNGLDVWEVWIAPMPIAMPQWTNNDAGSGAFDAEADPFNDMRLLYRILDLDGSSVGGPDPLMAAQDLGTICVERIEVQAISMDAIHNAATTVYSPALNDGSNAPGVEDPAAADRTHFPQSNANAANFPTVQVDIIDGVWEVQLPAVDDASDPGDFGFVRATLGPDVVAAGPIFDPDTNALNRARLYPIDWEAETLFRIRASVRSMAGSVDPPDLSIINMETSNAELGGLHYITSGFDANAGAPGDGGGMRLAGSPRPTASEWTGFFFSNNVSASTVIPDVARWKAQVEFFNRGDLGGGATSGQDRVFVESLEVDRIILP